MISLHGAVLSFLLALTHLRKGANHGRIYMFSPGEQVIISRRAKERRSVGNNVRRRFVTLRKICPLVNVGVDGCDVA